jgi:superfamily I DNA/RNA helicase
VGITRAMERLYICYVRKRWLFGKLRYCNPSPFLDSIEEELREAVNFSSRRKKGDGKEKRQLSLFFK